MESKLWNFQLCIEALSEKSSFACALANLNSVKQKSYHSSIVAFTYHHLRVKLNDVVVAH